VADEPILLIADVSGTMAERCEPGPTVYGEVWLRRYEGLVVVYWEVRETPLDADGEPHGYPQHTDILYGVARTQGPRRWQALSVLRADQLPGEVGPLPEAFADPARRDVLLRAALKAVNGELYSPLGRGRFCAQSYRWRQGSGARLT
jgi:hypothetical protein